MACPHRSALTPTEDPEWLRRLVERYQGRIFRAAYALLGNRSEADQVAQEVFVQVFFSIGSFDRRGSLFAWLYRLTIAECCTRFQSRDRSERFPLPILRIPEPYRSLLLLREVEGLTLAELAEATGQAEDSVRAALFQARRRLAQARA